jgi:hypothetical protein
VGSKVDRHVFFERVFFGFFAKKMFFLKKTKKTSLKGT